MKYTWVLALLTAAGIAWHSWYEWNDRTRPGPKPLSQWLVKYKQEVSKKQ